MAGLLSKERIVAGPRFNRWWNVVAALAINLSIGQAYAFSVFNLPLARVLGVSEPLPEDWKLSALGWIFTLAYVFLGLSAGVGGKWQDRVGPSLSGVVAAFCFGSGLFLSALGVWRHQLALLYLGYGVLGGCGLGLGFNTPISILLRWFPDRRGLATGMAIMGFGGGAILAAPLSTALMRRFATSTSVGVAETFVVLGALYTTAMLGGAFLFRLPPDGVPRSREEAGSPAAGLTAEQAVRTRPFPLLWGVLLVNVTAGLGVLGQAAAMIQEVFDGVSAETAGFFRAFSSSASCATRRSAPWRSRMRRSPGPRCPPPRFSERASRESGPQGGLADGRARGRHGGRDLWRGTPRGVAARALRRGARLRRRGRAHRGRAAPGAGSQRRGHPGGHRAVDRGHGAPGGPERPGLRHRGAEPGPRAAADGGRGRSRQRQRDHEDAGGQPASPPRVLRGHPGARGLPRLRRPAHPAGQPAQEPEAGRVAGHHRLQRGDARARGRPRDRAPHRAGRS